MNKHKITVTVDNNPVDLFVYIDEDMRGYVSAVPFIRAVSILGFVEAQQVANYYAIRDKIEHLEHLELKGRRIPVLRVDDLTTIRRVFLVIQEKVAQVIRQKKLKTSYSADREKPEKVYLEVASKLQALGAV